MTAVVVLVLNNISLRLRLSVWMTVGGRESPWSFLNLHNTLRIRYKIISLFGLDRHWPQLFLAIFKYWLELPEPCNYRSITSAEIAVVLKDRISEKCSITKFSGDSKHHHQENIKANAMYWTVTKRKKTHCGEIMLNAENRRKRCQ